MAVIRPEGASRVGEVSERVLRNGANERMQEDAERTQLGVYWWVAEKAEWKFRIVESGKRKMKPRLSFAFALVLAILAGALPMILAHGQATQKVVLQSQFKLTPFPTPASLMPGELACPFFLWTKDFTPEQRISFNYADKAGMAVSNTPVLTNVTIIIDSKDSVPVATTVSPLRSDDKVWEINMSQDTYSANAKCLKGISVKSSH
jgi:hypothetical protein